MKNEITKYKVNIYYLLGLCFIFSFTKPTFFAGIPSINNFYNICKIILYTIMSINVLKKFLSRTYRISQIAVFILVFYLILIISTIINKQNLLNVIQYSIAPILLVLTIDDIKRERLLNLLKGMSTMLLVLTCINFLTVLLFPNGMSYNTISGEKFYFLGHNNSVIRIILPGIIFSGLYDYGMYKRLKIKTYFFSLLTMLTVIITWSNTAMIGMGVIILFEMFFQNKEIDKMLNARKVFFVMIFLFLFLVIFQNIDILKSIIVNIFHKDITLSGRTTIWNYAIPILKKKIWIGYGNDATMPRIGNWTYEPSSFHNYFLDLVFKGGIMLVVTQLLIIWKCCMCLEQTKTRASSFLVFGLLSYFIMWQLEPFMSTGYVTMMAVFMMCNKCNLIDKGKNEKNEDI